MTTNLVDSRTPGLAELSRQIATGELTATEVVEQSLTRISSIEEEVRAWVHVDAAAARRTAGDLDDGPRRGPLHGIPVGIKDIIDVAGLPTECGSVLRRGRVPREDSPIVHWLRSQGAVILGKTVTTEFAYFSPGPTRNPHDPTRTPGGSSSGSAAAVASGMVPLALGTQTAASVIRPAAFCGVAGIVTTPGRCSTAGIAGLSHTLDSIGFLAGTAEDLAVVLPSAPRQDHLRILAWRPETFDLSLEMDEAMTSLVERLRSTGHHVEDLTYDGVASQLVDDHFTVMAYEAAIELADEARTGRLSQPLQALLDGGAHIDRRAVRAALDRSTRARDALLGSLADFDAILAPAALGVAPEGLDATGDPVLSRPWQLLGLPTLAVPGLTDPDGMPLGVQLVGRPCEEARLVSDAGSIATAIGARRQDGCRA